MLDNSDKTLATHQIMVYSGNNASDALKNCKDAKALVVFDSSLSTSDMDAISTLSGLEKLHLLKCDMNSITALGKLSNLDYL